MEFLYFVIETAIKVIVVFALVMLAVAYMTWLERKVLGHIQVRYGPNRVGPFGLLQPIADGIKAFFKEEVIPEKADKPVYLIAPAIPFVCALSMFAVIPFGDTIRVLGREVKLVIADVPIGLLFVFAMASLGEYGIVLGGWASYNKYSLLGALRAAAQMVSYEIAMGISVLGVLILSGTVDLYQIVRQQIEGHWFILYQPVGFLLFLICMFAEINRTPFDMPEAESELACGFNIEYSSMKFAMFFMAEYAHLLAASALLTTLFLGGWDGPWLPPSLSWIWFVVKVAVVVFFAIWVRGTYPRLRYDQIMKLGWKVLIPLGLANLFFTGLLLTV